MSMNFEVIFFFFLALFSIITAILVITRRNPISSAMFLVLNFFVLAGIYLTLSAQFLAIIQILVYAGAIMVLFVFVIMLLNLGDEEKFVEKINFKKFVRIVLSLALIVQIIYILSYSQFSQNIKQSSNAVNIGTVNEIGHQLFTVYLFPFEVTSILLLASIIGAVVLAKKRFP
jgi:NADH-quinone oxidoreductase subunit J